MRYTVSVSYVDVIGTIWMPATTAAYRYTLDAYKLQNLIDAKDPAETWREAVSVWVNTNAGDFQTIQDFSASLEIGEMGGIPVTVDIPWADEESEFVYNDCMYGDEE